jgi:hypothetical protein
MKKIIVTSTILGLIATSAFSQGFVQFFAGSSNGTKVSTNSVVGGAAVGRTAGNNTYYYALFSSSTQTTINGNAAAIIGNAGTYVFGQSGWSLVGFGANNGSGTTIATTQGTTDANQGALNSDGGLTVPNVAGGAVGNFVVVGWSANIGSTLASVESWLTDPTVTGWIGQSRIGVGQTIGDNASNPTLNVFGTTANYINAFSLGEVAGAPVPEPATMALAALGGASLLMLRRKK